MKSLTLQLETQKEFSTNIALTKEKELIEINKRLNETVKFTNNNLIEKENQHKIIIKEYDDNKIILLTKHVQIKKDLEEKNDRLSSELNEIRKNFEEYEHICHKNTISMQSELNQKTYEHEFTVCEMQKKFDAYKSDFELKLVEVNNL